MIKRAVIDYIQSNELVKKEIRKQFYKIFVMLNKNEINKLKKTIENFDKKGIITLVKGEFEKSWEMLISKVRQIIR